MTEERIHSLLTRVYGPETGDLAYEGLQSLMDKYRARIPAPRSRGLSQRDAILITYPDQVQEPGRPGLAVLGDFCEERLKGLISGIHILPFFPWSSDDGFSVVDYESVAPQYGQWTDMERLGAHFRLMFDAVINHASAHGSWFEGFLRGDPDFKDFFIEVAGNPDLSQVVRPRALPLLTHFNSPQGSRQVWTTFSADQIDLNYHNPRVLLRIMDVLLFYASQGAEFIRLDAIAYLWKELGTSCINLPQTHWIVQLIRAVLDEAAPHVLLITETNVPNLENLSYFGDGYNEAQLIYNFPLPPLVLHALQTGDASVLSKWAATLRQPSKRTTFLNFLASHDGVGLNPVRGILPESEINALVQRVEAAGGFISKKTNLDGTQGAYELNVNYFDALNAEHMSAGLDAQVARFLSAHAILLAFAGVPAIYFHSLFGSRGWPDGVRETGQYRTINRKRLQRDELEQQLADAGSLRARVFAGLSKLLLVRAGNPCFAANVPQRVLQTHSGVLAILREIPGTRQAVLCVQNVRSNDESVRLDLSGTALAASVELHDLLSGRQIAVHGVLSLTLEPYQSMWLVS